MLNKLIGKIFEAKKEFDTDKSIDDKDNKILMKAKDYDLIEPVELKPLYHESIKLLSANEAYQKYKEFDELIRNNTNMIVEIGYLRAEMLSLLDSDIEEGPEAFAKINEKLHRFVDAEKLLKAQRDEYFWQYHSIVGFRKKEFEHLLREYAQEGTSFWKFSQSIEGVAGEAGVFTEYVPGQLIESKDKDCLLSFVRAEDLCKCWRYGDQITKFSFDLQDERFIAIADYPAYETNNTFGEIKTDYLLPEANYSLSDIETLLTIINNSGEKKAQAAWHLFILPGFRAHVEKLGFYDTVSFIDYVNMKASDKEEPNFWISQNIQELYSDYVNGNDK